MTVEEMTDTVEVWPDNAVAVNTVIAMSTQWRVGFGGATGLDYSTLPIVLRMNAVPRKDWSDIFECVRIMEETALEAMRDKHG